MWGRAKSMFGKMTGKDDDTNRFFDNPGFMMEWQYKRLPGPGAMNAAYESLALSPESPISGAVAQRRQLHVTKPNTDYAFLAVPIAGIPMVSGQVIMQPLYDPKQGYTLLPEYQPSIAPNQVI